MTCLSTLKMNVVICPWHRSLCHGWQSSAALDRGFEVRPQHAPFHPVLMASPLNRAWHQTPRSSTGPSPKQMCPNNATSGKTPRSERGEEQECSGKGAEKGKVVLKPFSSRTSVKASGAWIYDGKIWIQHRRWSPFIPIKAAQKCLEPKTLDSLGKKLPGTSA